VAAFLWFGVPIDHGLVNRALDRRQFQVGRRLAQTIYCFGETLHFEKAGTARRCHRHL
jgi:hypothetical protein